MKILITSKLSLVFGTAFVIILSGGGITGAQEAQGGSSEGGGGTGGGGGRPPDLDFTRDENVVFDYDSYVEKESKLQIGSIGKPQGIGILTQAARERTTIALGEEGGVIAPQIPDYYVVEKGDTLYSLSQYFFGDPDLWPGIWALNPDITNPNWIYPGQALLLVPQEVKVEEKGEGAEGEKETQPGIDKLLGFVPWKSGTEYLRPYGMLEKEIEEASGKIVGAFPDTMYLDKYHKLYIKYKQEKTPKVGDSETIYEVLSDVRDHEKRNIRYGKLVRILGSVKITKVDKEHKIATGIVEECVRPIERGDLIGPIKWKFKKVEPVKASLDLEGKIIAPLEDVEHSGQFDIVFVNLGKKHGVREGNILKIVRKRDLYMESIGKKDKSKNFPWEVIGKAMVIESLKNTSTCLVLESRLDIRKGDKVWLKRGE